MIMGASSGVDTCVSVIHSLMCQLEIKNGKILILRNTAITVTSTALQNIAADQTVQAPSNKFIQVFCIKN